MNQLTSGFMRTFALALTFMTTVSLTYSQFTLTGEIRPRAEYRNGFKDLRKPGQKPLTFIEQRSRLYGHYEKDRIMMHIVFQDIRIWGSTDQIYKQDPNLQNIFEGWGQYAISDRFALKVGRMKLSYDNERFLGGLGWAQQSRSHDVIMLKYMLVDKGISVDVAGAYNQKWIFEPSTLNADDLFYDVANYKTMQFIWFNKKWKKGHVSLLVHNDGRQVAADSSMAYRQTLGLNAKKGLEKWEIGLEGYYQMGQNGQKTDVAAYMAGLYATYKTKLTPITLGGDFLSGTEVSSTEDNSFSPLYGTNHKFYGYMDYFYVGNAHRQATEPSAGLVDLYLKTKFKLNEKTSFDAHFHYFNSPVDLIDPSNPTENLNPHLGSEIDLVLLYKPSDEFFVHLGFSQLFAASSMRAIKTSNGQLGDNNWAWAMITFKPKLYESKPKPADE